MQEDEVHEPASNLRAAEQRQKCVIIQHVFDTSNKITTSFDSDSFNNLNFATKESNNIFLLGLGCSLSDTGECWFHSTKH